MTDLLIVAGIVVLLCVAWMARRSTQVGSPHVDSGPGRSPEPSAVRSAEAARDARFEELRLLVPSFELRGPALRSVKSSYEPKIKYQVNLAELTCSCPDFVKRRNQFEGRDARRICKHIYQLLVTERAMANWDDLLTTFLKEHNPARRLLQARLRSGKIIVIGRTPGAEWIDVYTHRRKKGERGGNFSGGYDRYGFNLQEKRWSFGRPPAAAGEIRELIANFVGW
jgi:hypothetical protein